MLYVYIVWGSVKKFSLVRILSDGERIVFEATLDAQRRSVEEGRGGGKGGGEKARERRWTAQFISVGLISVASRGLRLTFRWSFVRSFVRRSMGGGGGVRWGGGQTRGDRLFYGNILVGHTECRWRKTKSPQRSTVYRGKERRKKKKKKKKKRRTGGTRTHRPIKLQCPSKVHRRRQGSLDLPY